MKKLLFPLILMIMGFVIAGISFITGGRGSADLDIKIVNTPLIMPAVHRVYSNPEALDGKYYLFKAKITNNSKRTLEDLVVKYQIPGYIDWTEISTTGKIIPGQSVVVTCYPVFDQKITEKTTESVERATILVDWDGASRRDIVEESFSFKMLNRNDFAYTNLPASEIAGWTDMYDNDALITAFVTPNDPVVKYYTQRVQERVMRGEAASVYNTPELGVKFLLGLYEATLQAGMVYSGTKGIPHSLSDVQTLVQHVRLPREVITGNTGLCIELSTLYASVLSAAGLHPVIFLVPGHAYPGFRMNNEYYAIEATGIGGEGLGKIASAEEAFKDGMKQLEEFIKAAQMGDPRYNIVDIHELNARGVLSMHLEDSDYLRKRVDEIAASFGASRRSGRSGQLTQVSSTVANTAPSPTPTTQRFPGPLSFNIPSGWQTFNYPAPQLPVLTAQVISPDQTASVSIYDIPATSPSEALYYLAQYFYQLGMVLDYSINGNVVQGTTTSYSDVFTWKGKIRQVQGGYRFVAVGANNRTFQQHQIAVNAVFNSMN